MVQILNMETDTLIRRMEAAVEIVENRLKRATNALAAGGVDYAVIGGNAVRAWVAKVDADAVRNTRDVDLLLRRGDLDAAIQAMSVAGFTYRKSRGVMMFLDGPDSTASAAVHILFSGEKVRPTDIFPTPEVTEYEPSQHFRLIKLKALVQMKLTAFRLKDQMHLIDLFNIALIDETWIDQFEGEAADRLRGVIAQAKSERWPETGDD